MLRVCVLLHKISAHALVETSSSQKTLPTALYASHQKLSIRSS